MNTITRVLDQCRTCLAWKEIVNDIELSRLNLDLFQASQAKKELGIAQKILDQAILECYRYVMIPRPSGPNKVEFDVRRIGTTSSNIATAVEKSWSTVKRSFNAGLLFF